MAVLTGKRIAIVEDDAFLNMVLAELLEEAGATIVDQAFDLPRAMVIAEGTSEVDCAVLDINLRGAVSYPAANAFIARGVPVAFATAERPESIPVGLRGAPILQKPYVEQKIVEAVACIAKAD